MEPVAFDSKNNPIFIGDTVEAYDGAYWMGQWEFYTTLTVTEENIPELIELLDNITYVHVFPKIEEENNEN